MKAGQIMSKVPQQLQSLGLITLAVSLLVNGCGNAAEQAAIHTGRGSVRSTTVCLERFLFDIPGEPEIGGTSTEFDDGYGVSGVHSNGTGIPKWAGIEFSESRPTDLNGFAQIIAGARESYRFPEFSERSIAEIDEEITDLRSQIESFPADQRSRVRDMLIDRVLELEWIKYLKVNSNIVTMRNGQYAFRSGTDYDVGYFDKADSRVRMFAGRPARFDSTRPSSAFDELKRIQSFYESRAVTSIPTSPGFCTGHGFIHEPATPERKTIFESPFRSLSYPNLIFTVTIEPAWNDGHSGAPASSKYLPYLLNMVGLRASEMYGPVEVDMGGSRGVIHGMKYNPKCGEENCVPLEQAYEFTAKTYGERGRVDRPRIELKMVAALSDDYKAKLKTAPGQEYLKQVDKPGLKGLTPPPYEVGRAIFESVVKSIRLRPGAIASQTKDNNSTNVPDHP
jgi:hypothetical protein